MNRFSVGVCSREQEKIKIKTQGYGYKRKLNEIKINKRMRKEIIYRVF